MGPHEIAKAHPSFRTAGEQRPAFRQAGQEFAGAERIVDESSAIGVDVIRNRGTEERAIQRAGVDRLSDGSRELAEQADPCIEIGGEVVGVAHTSQITGRSGDEIHFRMQSCQLVFEHHHGEDRSAGGNVASAHAHGIGGHHSGAGVTFRRGEGDARLEGAGRVEQLGAFGGEFACRSTGHQRFGK